LPIEFLHRRFDLLDASIQIGEITAQTLQQVGHHGRYAGTRIHEQGIQFAPQSVERNGKDDTELAQQSPDLVAKGRAVTLEAIAHAMQRLGERAGAIPREWNLL
jgi:hypothetical protein